MNTEKPHDILDERELRRLPAEQRSNYRPITPEAAKVLAPMSVEERAEYLSSLPPLPEWAKEKMARAQAKRDRKAKR